ncbi:MAG: hypothetical protein R3F37_01560 [Candidatus Competibacteraceae bacterium]
MRLAAAHGADGLRRQNSGSAWRRKSWPSKGAPGIPPALTVLAASPEAAERMTVGRNLADRQRDLFHPAGFGQDETITLVNRQTAPQIG